MTATRPRSAPHRRHATPVYTSRCGLGEPQLLGVQEGISVGYGDDYKANLEGQYLRLTGLPAGRYVLVHQVNADRRLHELDYANDAASLLLELRWRHGQPMVRILRQCPNTDRCDRRPPSPPRVKTVATGLEIPWEIAFLPDGRALVTERPGRVRLLGSDGRLRRAPVARVAVSSRGEGGLLGLAVDPDFAHNHFVYLYYTTAGGHAARALALLERAAAARALARRRHRGRADPRQRADRLRPRWPALRRHRRLGQRRRSPRGPTPSTASSSRCHPSSTAAPAGAPEIVSLGHRNPQGFDWEPGTGRLIATEHGPTQGLDGPGRLRRDQ